MGLGYRPKVPSERRAGWPSLFTYRDHGAGPPSDRALSRARHRLRALGS